jgi:hypothetical protein
MFLEAPKKKKKLECDFQRVFKDNWGTKFPWVELRVDPNGKVWQVCYKIYSIVEGKEKLLNPKLDNLQKHSNKRKTLVAHLKVVMGEYYQSFES